MLPNKGNRYGAELTCEIVEPGRVEEKEATTPPVSDRRLVVALKSLDADSWADQRGVLPDADLINAMRADPFAIAGLFLAACSFVVLVVGAVVFSKGGSR